MKIDSNIGKREYNLSTILGQLKKQLSQYAGGRAKGYETLQNLVNTGSVSGTNLKKIKNTIESDPNAKALFGDAFYGWICTQLDSDRQSAASGKQMKSELGLNPTKRRNKYQMKPQGTKVAIVANNTKGVRYIGEAQVKNILITEAQFKTINENTHIRKS